MKNFGCYIGRFCPMHLGHEAIINYMLKTFYKNSIIFIGSCNKDISLRNFFTYTERRKFIETIFPDVKILPLPDAKNCNGEWILFLKDILNSFDASFENTTFIGGCEEDLNVLLNFNAKCKIVNRFDGSTIKISATEVRDNLIHNRPLEGLINPLVRQLVKDTFKLKWENFRKL